MEYNFTRQKSIYDCGVAVSTMLINSLQKKHFTIEEIKYENQISDSELSFYNIEELLNKYKIEFKTYHANFNEFIELNVSDPVVLNINEESSGEHFIIIYKRKKNLFLVADPNNNDLTWVSFSDIAKKYTGYFGIARKTETIIFKNKSFFNWIKLFSDYINYIVLFFVLSILLNSLIIISNSFLKVYSNNVMIDDKYNLNILFLSFLLLFMIQNVVGLFNNIILFNIKKLINKKIIKIYINKIILMNIEKYDSLGKEEWIKKLQYINLISDRLVNYFLFIPTQFILFLMSLIIVASISKSILIFILIENLISVFISYLFYNWVKDKNIKHSTDEIKFLTTFREIIDGNFEIKAKNLNNHFELQFLKKYKKNIKNEKDLNYIKNFNELATKTIARFFYLLIFYVSADLIANNLTNFSQLLFYVSISNYIYIFTNSIFNLIISKEENKICIKELKFLFEKNEVEENKSLLEIDKIEKIELQNIYKFQNENKLIDNVTHTFSANTFIFGKSGSGKTSLLKLLSGNIENYEGNFLINQVDFKNINKQCLKNRVTYLGQYDYLFNASVWTNIQQFKNKIDLNIFKEYKLFELMENNNIDINKKIIDNGANLSKGQRQIISFISLFFTSKDVYLVDEPLSNVDKKTAYYLMRAFLSLKKDSLIIMTDHDNEYQKLFSNRMEI
ncbi:hypothetical protein SHELI_v1c06770 [Spiroplasma helicoides]|uniref:Bacteriocin ABC transporter n=1 Tax=Spiroplasma helicoides TaxID=216938 RepID=A0A1B3SL12_9MOLU|nr:ATP-binding cassette domain-containing protein [Spiroplasma helicoides]AOG60628.1 hypothetical protein SHELI_v1c06770 [Spiroplasma helicoides]